MRGSGAGADAGALEQRLLRLDTHHSKRDGSKRTEQAGERRPVALQAQRLAGEGAGVHRLHDTLGSDAIDKAAACEGGSEKESMSELERLQGSRRARGPGEEVLGLTDYVDLVMDVAGVIEGVVKASSAGVDSAGKVQRVEDAVAILRCFVAGRGRGRGGRRAVEMQDRATEMHELSQSFIDHTSFLEDSGLLHVQHTQSDCKNDLKDSVLDPDSQNASKSRVPASDADGAVSPHAGRAPASAADPFYQLGGRVLSHTIPCVYCSRLVLPVVPRPLVRVRSSSAED
jgi:hypothetical protein